MHKAPSSEGELTLDLRLDTDPERGEFVARILRVGGADRGGYLAIFTERRALDSLQANLRLASQMRRLHTTYRHAAHDLRAPLNAIALNLDLIRQDVSDETAGQEARNATLARVGMLQREVMRLSRMLQVLLAQSGPPRYAPREFGLRRLLREVVELIAPQADRLGIRVSLRLPESRLAVVAARDHLKQALLNLLVNALEAMPRGGPIEMALSGDDARAVITIRDHGVGIPARHLDRIFSMHYTTKPGSSGIGLFTTRAAIESMGGRLTLESTEGLGTTARIELPMVVSDTAPQEASCSTY